MDAEDSLVYLRSNRQYKELMDRYWPTSDLTTQEKLKRTANTVGFSLPETHIEAASESQDQSIDKKNACA